MKVISVISQKGGSGKSTTAALLTISKAAQGLKVLCVDTDPQGGLTSFLTGKEPEGKRGVFDYIMGEDIEPVRIEKHGCTFDLLPADYRLDKVFASSDIYTFKELSQVYSSYDLIIFDTPPTLQGISKSCAFIADKIITPADISRGSISPTIYTVETLRQMEKSTSVFLIGYKENLKSGFIADLQNEFLQKLNGSFKGAIPKSVTLQKIATTGKATAGNIETIKNIFMGAA